MKAGLCFIRSATQARREARRTRPGRRQDGPGLRRGSPGENPAIFFHLGDVIYNFGERGNDYDQFYEPYRDYPAPIVALAGNHDGMAAPGVTVPTLAAFVDNFCAEAFEVRPEAGGLSRTAQIQPGVFFTFEAAQEVSPVRWSSDGAGKFLHDRRRLALRTLIARRPSSRGRTREGLGAT